MFPPKVYVIPGGFQAPGLELSAQLSSTAKCVGLAACRGSETQGLDPGEAQCLYPQDSLLCEQVDIGPGPLGMVKSIRWRKERAVVKGSGGRRKGFQGRWSWVNLCERGSRKKSVRGELDARRSASYEGQHLSWDEKQVIVSFISSHF